MATKTKRSFWSTIPGLLTGLAGVLTAVVTLLGLAVNQGWIGDGGGGDGGTASAGAPRITVEPEGLTFRKVAVKAAAQTVTVLNDGAEPVTLESDITGDDAETFTADDAGCTKAPLPPGRTCAVEVTFDAGIGQYSATLVVTANGGDGAQEVPLEATSVL
ncbi:MAG: hypothetical protein ACR2G7_05145 [Acidimicrobiales bacterium]